MPPKAPQETPYLRQEVRRSLLTSSLVLGLFTVAAGLVLVAGVREGGETLHTQLEFFAVFAGLAAALLAAAKYVVTRDRVYVVLGTGLLAVSLMDLLGPAVAGMLSLSDGADPDRAASVEGYFWAASRIAFGVTLLLAAKVQRAPQLDDRPQKRLLAATLGVTGFIVLLVPLIVLAPWPNFYAQGAHGPLLHVLPLLLYLPAVYILLDATRPEQVAVRNLGLATLAIAVLTQLLSLSSNAPLDAAFFGAHVAKVGSYLVLLFGLFLEHVRLYSVERSLRESLETSHLALRSSKSELDAVIENLTEGVAIADSDGRILRFNRAAEEILGRRDVGARPHEFTSRFHVQTVDGAPFPTNEFPIVRALKEKQPVRDVEMVIHRPDGSPRTIVGGAVPLIGSSDRPRGAVVAFHDVTEIRQTAQRFRDLTEGAPDAILVLDDHDRVILYNKAAERMLQTPREHVYGKPFRDLVAPRILDAQSDLLERVLDPAQSDGQHPLDLRFRRRDGREVPVELSVSRGGVPGSRYRIIHARDASDRERTRREREGILSVAHASASTTEANQFLDLAANAITVATDFDACLIYLHDEARNALDLHAGAGVPDDIRARIQTYPADAKFPAIAVRTWFERATLVETNLPGRTELHVSAPLVRKYGYQYLMSTILGPASDPWGVVQVVASEERNPREDDRQILELLAEEITTGLRQKRLIRQLEDSGNELRKTNRELDSFIYTASHDLAEPLRSISNFSHFLLEDYADRLDGEGRDYLTRVHGGAMRMKRLLEDLLRLSRHGRSHAPKLRLHLNEVLDEVRESLHASLSEHGGELVYAESLPDVVADRTSLVEVFSNLIGNAIKFNKSKAPKVRVSAQRIDGMVEVEVRDNGIGISPEHHDRVFGLFTRLHPRRDYEGTGAGLAIVKKILDGHGGKIWIQESSDKGTTFAFSIPAAPAPPDPLEVAQTRGSRS